jgi:hypothetical protein
LAGASAAALLGFAAVAGLFRVRAYDLFWHLAAGRWIVEHGRVPMADPFRFTSGGAPWVDHEWLFQVAAFGIERLAGLPGLVLARAAAAVALAALLLAGLRRSGAPLAWAVPVALAAVLGARPRMFLRPELVTLVALALLLSLLQAWRRAGTGRRRLAWAAAMVGLVVLWANAHPGALAAPPVALVFLLGARLPGGSGGPRRGTAPPSWATIAGLPLALAAALVANPSGAAIFAVPGAIGGSLADLSGVNPEWLPLWNPAIAHDSVYLFTVLVALVALATVALRRTARLDPATGLAALAVAGLAATSIRHQALFYVAAAFFAGECLAQLAARSSRNADDRAARDRRVAALGAVLCLLAGAWAVLPPARGPLAPLQGRYSPGLGLEPGRFPGHLAGAVAGEWREVGNLYNNVAWGGYLLWRLYPPRQVFLDGRNEVDPEILRQLAAARVSSREWEALLDRYDVDGALVRYEDRLLRVVEPGPSGAPVVAHRTPHAVLFPRDRFALVAWDDTGMLLVRRTPERAARLAREEYRHLDPEDVRWTLTRAAADPAFRQAARAEAERRLREAPPCERARGLAAALQEAPP